MILTLPRRFAAALVVGAALALSACAAPQSAGPAAPDEVPTPARTEYFGDPVDENDLIVRHGDTELHLASLGEAATYGPAPADLPSVAADELYVFVRPAGWPLTASQFTGDDPRACGETSRTPDVRALGGGWWSVRPVGPAGQYTLLLSAASGPGLPAGGEIGLTAGFVALQTSQDRPLPPPETWLTVDAYENEPGRVSLGIYGLAESPETSSATLTLTAEDGSTTSSVLAATPRCSQVGNVDLEAVLDVADASAYLEGRFEYNLEVVMDGETRRAHGSGTNGEWLTPAFEPALD